MPDKQTNKELTKKKTHECKSFPTWSICAVQNQFKFLNVHIFAYFGCGLKMIFWTWWKTFVFIPEPLFGDRTPPKTKQTQAKSNAYRCSIGLAIHILQQLSYTLCRKCSTTLTWPIPNGYHPYWTFQRYRKLLYMYVLQAYMDHSASHMRIKMIWSILVLF